MIRIFLSLVPVVIALASACNESPAEKKQETKTDFEKGSFGYDLDFLRKYDSVIVLSDGAGSGKVVVSPKYQAKVFTSTAAGDTGKSFGWINYSAFTAAYNPHINAFGGENRFWLGPEGGVYSLYFEKGKEMVFDNWKTPGPIDTAAWNLVSRTPHSVSMDKDMQISNYAGTELNIQAGRTITLMTDTGIGSRIGMTPGQDVRSVAYLSSNYIKNTGSGEWNEKTGMPCIWILDMFNPSENTVIAIPYKNDASLKGKVATTDYFGEIPSDRIRIEKGVLLFKADGKSRGKLGIGPSRAKPVAGSYDPVAGVLTIVMFDTIDPRAKYLNQEWNTTKPPFSGDAVNAYNDGPLEDGTQMGPFYELESVSPAAFLKPGETLTHNHYVFHFTGNQKSLNDISAKLLGISLENIQNAFKGNPGR